MSAADRREPPTRRCVHASRRSKAPALSPGVRGGEVALGPSHLDSLLAQGRLRATLAMLGPAFVAAIAYVDPGNFATNIARRRAVRLPAAVGRARRQPDGDADPVPVGEARDRHRPQPARAVSRALSALGCRGAMWVQAEVMAMATDVAEFVGAALGLNLLFGVPLLPAGLMTGVIAFAILELQIARLPALRAGDHGAAGDHLPRLPVRDAEDRALRARVASAAWCRTWATATACIWRSASSARP